MEFRTTLHFEKTNQYIEVDNGIQKYNISIIDLYEYLKNKNNNDINQSEIETSEDSNISLFLNELLKEEHEIIDEFTNMNDNQLILSVTKLLEKANDLNISEYYKKKDGKVKKFNLRGLVLNNSIRYNSDSARRKIRDLGRKCIQFLGIKRENIETNIHKEESIVNNDISNNLINITIQKSFPETLQNTSFIESHSKTCIYEFKRGDLKGKICGQPSIENQSYCNTCIGRTKLRTNLTNPIQHKLVLK